MFILTLFVLFGMSSEIVSADDITILSANPSTNSISSGETFTVDVYCVPAQMIKSFELKISFDASLLQANSVVEGNIFDGYSTFFNEGIIDNTAGTIVSIYDLIIGSDMVSDSGTFVTISFSAQSISGTSTIDIYDAGVTDDSGYVTISVLDGEATVIGSNSPPTFSVVSPANQSTGVSIGTSSLSLTINDADDDSLNWTIEPSIDIGSSSGTNELSGSKSCSISGLEYATTYHWFVSCVDAGSETWNNKSYWFTTETYSGGGSGGGIFTPVDEYDDDQNDTSGNNPPETPVEPSGSIFVEPGVEYSYSVSTYDIDGDQIKYRFNWGDGTFSEWTGLVSSNNSILMSHSWSSVASYYVRVIAQDESGTNSSWSSFLEVIVSQIEGEGEEPVVDIIISDDDFSDNSMIFDASGSYDTDGVIVSYEWDFGDGHNGSGVNPVHEYSQPGEYIVTLVITDNNGITYSKSIPVVVGSGVDEQGSAENENGLPFIFLVGIGGVIAVILVCLVVFFRDRLPFLSSTEGSGIYSHKHAFGTRDKLAEIDAKIVEVRKKQELKEKEINHSGGFSEKYGENEHLSKISEESDTDRMVDTLISSDPETKYLSMGGEGKQRLSVLLDEKRVKKTEGQVDISDIHKEIDNL